MFGVRSIDIISFFTDDMQQASESTEAFHATLLYYLRLLANMRA